VALGQLAPVDERLPKNPMLIQPVERVGQYGGVWRSAFMGPTDVSWIERVIGYEPLVRWNSEWTRVIPNVAEHYQVNADATEFTFRLRRGMRWSDGAPFTADDVLFWHEVTFGDRDLGLSYPPWLYVNGKAVVVKKIDEATVVFKFAAPHSLFLPLLATYRGSDPVTMPKHYFAPFHIRYNPEGMDQLLRQTGTSNWMSLFRLKVGMVAPELVSSRLNNPEPPNLLAWLMEQGIQKSGPLKARRNPYYWKVDTAGNQLPYIDRLYFNRVTDPQQLLDMAMRGEFDFYERMALSTAANRSLLEEHRSQGRYRFFQVLRDSGNHAVIMLNLTHTNLLRRRLYQDKNFRIGLSLAIDRPRIIREAFLGRGQPYQAAPRPESPFYFEPLAKQYAEYNPELANQYLERAGLTPKNAEGWRRLPNGERATITIETDENRLPVVRTLEEVRKDWRAVGVELIVSGEPRSVFYPRKRANLLDASAWTGDGGMDVLLECRYYFPVGEESNYAIPWAMWFLDPSSSQAQEPPPPARRQMELYSRIQSTTNTEEQRRLLRQILEIAAEEFYVIGVALPDLGYGIVNQDLRNVPSTIPDAGFNFPCPGPANPCQFFFQNVSQSEPPRDQF
jgi:peptide/nickel transport system substrate-binding protein